MRTHDEAVSNCKLRFASSENGEFGRLFEPRTQALNSFLYDFADNVYEDIGVDYNIESSGLHIGVDDRYIAGSFRFISDRSEVPYTIHWHSCCVPISTNGCVQYGYNGWYGYHNYTGPASNICDDKAFSVCEAYIL